MLVHFNCTLWEKLTHIYVCLAIVRQREVSPQRELHQCHMFNHTYTLEASTSHA